MFQERNSETEVYDGFFLISGFAVTRERFRGLAARSVERFRKYAERESAELKASARALMRVSEIGFPFPQFCLILSRGHESNPRRSF